MADCTLLQGCLFFNDKMGGTPATAEIYKKRYCKGDPSGCGRFMIATTLGREKVPVDLFPNQTEQAKKIITDSK